LHGRRFFDRSVQLKSEEDINEAILAEFPTEENLKDSIFRLIVYYPREWDALIDEPEIRRRAEGPSSSTSSSAPRLRRAYGCRGSKHHFHPPCGDVEKILEVFPIKSWIKPGCLIWRRIFSGWSMKAERKSPGSRASYDTG
jgi:hypothetical protein